MNFDQNDPDYVRGMQSYLSAEWTQAESIFKSLNKKYPDSAYILLQLGEIYYSIGRLDESLAIYKKSLALNPENNIFHYKIGVCAYRAGKLEEALESFKRVNETNSGSHAMASYFIGLINFFLGNEKESAVSFDKLRKESSESKIANFFLAQLKIKNNQFTAAISLLEELLVITPHFAEIYYLLGDAYYKTHDITKALQCIRKALELNPNDKRSAVMLEFLTISA